MAIGWLTALKVIPWGEVIDAAPVIVKGARRFFARTQASEAETETALAPARAADALERLAHLEAGLAQMVEQQQASAELIESLAEQNAKVVQAIEILRVRTRMLLGTVLVLAVVVVALGCWLALR